jgi:hypothetical protein
LRWRQARQREGSLAAGPSFELAGSMPLGKGRGADGPVWLWRKAVQGLLANIRKGQRSRKQQQQGNMTAA